MHLRKFDKSINQICADALKTKPAFHHFSSFKNGTNEIIRVTGEDDS
jgi:hypothetical protein